MTSAVISLAKGVVTALFVAALAIVGMALGIIPDSPGSNRGIVLAATLLGAVVTAATGRPRTDR